MRKIIVFLYLSSIQIKILKQFISLLIILLFHSCQYFEKQVPSEKELLQKELKSIKALVEGSLFRIELDEYVYGVGLN